MIDEMIDGRLIQVSSDPIPASSEDRRVNYFNRSSKPWEERLPWETYVLGSNRLSNCWGGNCLPPYVEASVEASVQAYTKSWLEHKCQEDLNKEKHKEKKKNKKKKKKKKKAEGKTNLSLETPPLKKHKATAEQDVVVNGFHKEDNIINSEAAVQDDQVVIFNRLKITKSEAAVQDDQDVVLRF